MEIYISFRHYFLNSVVCSQKKLCGIMIVQDFFLLIFNHFYIKWGYLVIWIDVLDFLNQGGHTTLYSTLISDLVQVEEATFILRSVDLQSVSKVYPTPLISVSVNLFSFFDPFPFSF